MSLSRENSRDSIHRVKCKKFQQAIVLDTPLIRLAQQASGILKLSMVDRLVAAANHQYLKMIFG